MTSTIIKQAVNHFVAGYYFRNTRGLYPIDGYFPATTDDRAFCDSYAQNAMYFNNRIKVNIFMCLSCGKIERDHPLRDCVVVQTCGCADKLLDRKQPNILTGEYVKAPVEHLTNILYTMGFMLRLRHELLNPKLRAKSRYNLDADWRPYK